MTYRIFSLYLNRTAAVLFKYNNGAPLSVAVCCNRLYVGDSPAQGCGTCGKTEMVNHTLAKMEEIPALATLLSTPAPNASPDPQVV